MKKQYAEIALKENQLEKALTKFNELKAGNRSLRKEIDVMRKQ